ncbi:GntR family transcriptional regulator [Geminicoccus roseus]|uniref:GntR family transcriptional regulator n=1 Tax=Geminicoccus roseus TaxID=404900 RepID=UPI000420AD6F|nr:GntR family transcriptional regulator [Geminicoccus roseus]
MNPRLDGPDGVDPPASARERSDRLYGILRDRICTLAYPPGMRLSEEELAEEFHVSRTPVRRVLTRLENEGLVTIVHGVGTLVTDVELDQLIQVYHLRLELAVLLGKLSPVPREPADLDRIRRLIEDCGDLSADADHMAFARLNMAFFAEISAMTGNATLREISERLYYQTTRIVLKMLPILNLTEEVAAFRQEMTEILAALQVGDLEAVGHLRRAHISMSLNRMLRYAASTGAEPVPA